MQQLFELLNGKTETRLSREQRKLFEEFLSAFNYNTTTHVDKTALRLGIDRALVEDVLNKLVEIGEMKKEAVIQCPKCWLLFDKAENRKREMFCYGCEKNVEIEADDIVVVYTLCRKKV